MNPSAASEIETQPAPTTTTPADPGAAERAEALPMPPIRTGEDLLAGDLSLLEGVRREAPELEAELTSYAAPLASEEWIERGFSANEHPPEHVGPARDGSRSDSIRFHPAWHELMKHAVEGGVSGGAWRKGDPAAHAARAAKFMLIAQVEAGITCPLAMTHSCVPALRLQPEVAERWEPLVSSGVYDPREVPAVDKAGALIGMALTERTGGSDLGGMGTVASKLPAAESGPDGSWRIDGSKWFVSAAQSDAFFVLAKTENGISCLLAPRLRADGSPNGMRIDRLKDKLGNRSNPTAEMVLRDTRAELVGPEGKGVRTIMAMIGGTRHDCVLGSTAVVRLGTSEAIHWATHREAFGRPLIEAPAMEGVLADLALESEAATCATMWLAGLHGRAVEGDAEAETLRRAVAPVLKYWICKRAPIHLSEAIECQGGFGYIEDSRLARAYREAPLMSIWEGSGTVQALDMLRAMQRSPESMEALMSELAVTAGTDAALDAEIAALGSQFAAGDVSERNARLVIGRLARALQASLLHRFAPAEVADAFSASRVADGGRSAFGELPDGVDTAAIVARARPDRGPVAVG